MLVIVVCRMDDATHTYVLMYHQWGQAVDR